MKVKVTTVEEIEVDVTYPSYKKDPAHYYKMINDNETIQVCTLKQHETIKVIDTSLMYCGSMLSDEATEYEFISAYVNTLSIFNKLISNE